MTHALYFTLSPPPKSFIGYFSIFETSDKLMFPYLLRTISFVLLTSAMTTNYALHEGTPNYALHKGTPNSALHKVTPNSALHKVTPNYALHKVTPNYVLHEVTPNYALHGR